MSVPYFILCIHVRQNVKQYATPQTEVQNKLKMRITNAFRLTSEILYGSLRLILF